MKYLNEDHTSSGTHVGIAPFDESDWPIAWAWMLRSWHYIADDYTFQDLDHFLDLKAEQNAIHLGVYRNDELGGLLMLEPKSPYLCQAHAVYRPAEERREWTSEVLLLSLELGKQFAWRAGYSKIVALTFEDNTLMTKLVTSVGGFFEGRFHQETIRDGVPVTMVRYGILKANDK